MNSPSQDPQAQNAYKWEASFGHSNIKGYKSIHYGREWIRWACKKYKVPPPVVVDQIKGRDFSGYRPYDHRIWILEEHRNIWTCLHEAAHAITQYHFKDWTHGPRWLAVYIDLLVKAEIAPRIALTASAKAMGLKYRAGTIRKGKGNKRR